MSLSDTHPIAMPYLRQLGYGPTELAYFSVANVARVMSMIIERVRDISGIEVGPQDERELVLVMRSTYVSSCGPSTIETMNRRVIDACSENILVNLSNYIKYREDIMASPTSRMLTPRPEIENRATSRSLE
jgi:hypothetical protein